MSDDGLRNMFQKGLMKGLVIDGQVIQKNKAVGRNDPCPCNSGKKFKKCCLNK